MRKFLITVLMCLIAFPSWGAVNFDGTNDKINGVNLTHNVVSGYSVSAWVYHSSLTTDDYIEERHEGTNGGYLFFRDDVDSSTGRTDIYKIFVQETSAGGGTAVFVSSAQNASVLNTWTHVAWTFQVASGTGLRLYINGIEDANSPTSTSALSSLGNANNEILEIGASDSSSHFAGKITEIANWNTILTADEVKLLFDSKVKGMPLQIQPSSLLMYLPLDDHPHNDTADSANGLTFLDRSGNNNTGTAVGCNAQAETILSYP